MGLAVAGGPWLARILRKTKLKPLKRARGEGFWGPGVAHGSLSCQPAGAHDAMAGGHLYLPYKQSCYFEGHYSVPMTEL